MDYIVRSSTHRGFINRGERFVSMWEELDSSQCVFTLTSNSTLNRDYIKVDGLSAFIEFLSEGGAITSAGMITCLGQGSNFSYSDGQTTGKLYRVVLVNDTQYDANIFAKVTVYSRPPQ